MAQLLRADRHLLILDNAESITATTAAIPHALETAEQAQIRALLTRLHGGRTLVLIGSREAEAWLAPGSFGPNIYPLPGLDPQAASTLADRILRRHQAARWLGDDAEREALGDLVELLGGYPLPMTVVLPVLAAAAPSQVLAELKGGDPGADPTEKIIRAIEYSHGKLDPDLQASLLLLAPFTAVIPPVPILEAYRDILMQDDSARVTGEADLGGAIAEAIRVGLAAPHPQLTGYVQVQPVFPYFLRSRIRDYPGLKDAIAQAHYRLYARIGAELQHLLTDAGDARARAVGQAVTRAEYANLATAVTWGLRAGQPIMDLIGPLEEYLDQARQQTARQKLLQDAIASYPPDVSETRKAELARLYHLAGITAQDQRRLAEAEASYRQALDIFLEFGDRRNAASTYHSLGSVAYEQRRLPEAEASYRQALDIFLEFGDRRNAASTYHNLGSVAQEQRRFEEAEVSYRQALDIKLEFGDRHSAASTYHQLGAVAQQQRRYEEAEASYRHALDIFLEFGDRHSAASTYHQLGMIAQEQRRSQEAEVSYRQALDINLEFGDRHSAASTYHQLGAVAQQQRRYEEAEASYRHALDIKLEFGDRHSAASTYHQLGAVAQQQRRYEEAEASYRHALDIFLEFGDRHSAASTYHQLGIVAEEQGRYEEAEDRFRMALDIYLEYGDLHSAARTHYQLGGIAREQQHYEEAGRATAELSTSSWILGTRDRHQPQERNWASYMRGSDEIMMRSASCSALHLCGAYKPGTGMNRTSNGCVANETLSMTKSS